MYQIHKFTFNIFEENTYILYNQDKKGVIIDPGCSNIDEEQILENFFKTEGITIEYILNTHFHIDHVIGNNFIKKLYPDSILIFPKLEKEYLKITSELISPDFFPRL